MWGWFRVLGKSQVEMGGLLGKWGMGLGTGEVKMGLGTGKVGMVTGVRY